MEQIDNLKELINQGDVDIAIKQLERNFSKTILSRKIKICSTIYGEMPTEKRRLGSRRWITTSMLSTSIRTAPPVQARTMAIDILNFYHKDMYNQ